LAYNRTILITLHWPGRQRTTTDRRVAAAVRRWLCRRLVLHRS